MIVTTVETKISKEVKKFVFESRKRLTSPKVHSGLHLGFKLQAFERKEEQKLFLSFAYGMIGEAVLLYIGLILGSIIVVFGGFSFWLLIPLFFVTLPYFMRLLGFWLLHKGLRKAGYKDKVKLVSNNNFIYEVVLNGSK